MVKCPKCGASVEDKFCTECGTKIDSANKDSTSKTKTCPKCGAEVKEKFCSECGTRVELDVEGNVAKTKFCPNCAHEVNSDSIICLYCGHNFREADIAKERKRQKIQKDREKELQKIEKAKHRSIPRCILAIILSLVLPGSGHFLFKEYKKGLMFIVIGFVLWFSLLYLSLYLCNSPGTTIILWLCGLWIYNILVLYLLYDKHIKADNYEYS